MILNENEIYELYRYLQYQFVSRSSHKKRAYDGDVVVDVVRKLRVEYERITECATDLDKSSNITKRD